MHSNSHGSEEKLAVFGCAGLAAKRGARVLIGGLGMGFTARAALGVLAADAAVEVVELVGAVVRWNRDVFGHLAGAPLGDARLGVIEGDVAATIAGGARATTPSCSTSTTGRRRSRRSATSASTPTAGLRAAARALGRAACSRSGRCSRTRGSAPGCARPASR